jgi:hypothetical protein
MKKSNSLRNIVFVAVAGVIGTCICLFVVVATAPKTTTAPKATEQSLSGTSPTSTEAPSVAKTEPPAPTDIPALANTPTPAVDSHPTELIMDVPKLIGATRSDVEAILGKPIRTESISPDGLDDIPNGGEMRTYQVGAYEVDVDFDSQLATTGLQVVKGLTEEDWSLTDWPMLLVRVGLDITVAPDVSNDKNFIWHNVDGYGILIGNDKVGGQVWTVRVFLCRYSSLFPCSP